MTDEAHPLNPVCHHDFCNWDKCSHAPDPTPYDRRSPLEHEHNLTQVDEGKGPLEVGLLRAIVRYDPNSGKLFWIARPDHFFVTAKAANGWNRLNAGKEALIHLNKRGYYCGSVLRCGLLAHRVAYTIYHGRWPDFGIDHIDGDKTNNRIENLRSVSQSANNKNVRLKKGNKSGFHGVVPSRRSGYWVAKIRASKKDTHLGTFATIEEAAMARKKAELELGFHENHGK